MLDDLVDQVLEHPAGAPDAYPRPRKWELAVIERAERLDLHGVLVPVPRTADIILKKLAAGGPIDLQDLVFLLATDREPLIQEVEANLHHLQRDAIEAWNRIKLG